MVPRVTGLALNAAHCFVNVGMLLERPGGQRPEADPRLYLLARATGRSSCPSCCTEAQPAFRPRCNRCTCETLISTCSTAAPCRGFRSRSPMAGSRRGAPTIRSMPSNPRVITVRRHGPRLRPCARLGRDGSGGSVRYARSRRCRRRSRSAHGPSTRAATSPGRGRRALSGGSPRGAAVRGREALRVGARGARQPRRGAQAPRRPRGRAHGRLRSPGGKDDRPRGIGPGTPRRLPPRPPPRTTAGSSAGACTT